MLVWTQSSYDCIVGTLGGNCDTCNDNTYIQMLVLCGIVCEYLMTTLCRIEAKGVTPIPAPMRTACSAWNMLVDALLYGPSMYT